MGRIYVSGVNDEALEQSATEVREVIADLNPDGDGRIFYLTSLTVSNELTSAAVTVELWDQDTDATGTAANQRGAIIIGPGDTVIATWPDGAMPFVTNCCATTTVDASVAAYSMVGSGYLA
jgi:hypothetical protein